MERPWVLRLLPERLRTSAWGRLYRGQHARWAELYRDARLQHAPDLTMELVPGDAISDAIAFTGLYELPLSRRIARLARSGGTFVDVGANLGYFALLWAAAQPGNRCFAFEASPRNLELLRRNVSRNRLESRIRLIPHAAGRVPGRMHFDLGPADQTGWGGFAAAGPSAGVEVEVVRVDDVVPADARISLLKVDIEGADAWALMGCGRLLEARRVDEIWFEQNKPRMRALGIPEDAAEDYLRSVGYLPAPVSRAQAEVVEWRAVPAGRPTAGP